MWHFKWNAVEGKKKRRSNASPFPGSLNLKYLKNDITNIQHRRGDVKCFADYFRLQSSQLQNFVNGSVQSVSILAAGSCKVGLATATALDKLGGLFHQVSGFQSACHEVVAQHDGQHRLAFGFSSCHEEQVFRNLATQLEGDVLHCFCQAGEAQNL